MPSAARNENASRNTIASTPGICDAWLRITNRPPAKYRPTLSGESFSAARPIE